MQNTFASWWQTSWVPATTGINYPLWCATCVNPSIKNFDIGYILWEMRLRVTNLDTPRTMTQLRNKVILRNELLNPDQPRGRTAEQEPKVEKPLARKSEKQKCHIGWVFLAHGRLYQNKEKWNIVYTVQNTNSSV